MKKTLKQQYLEFLQARGWKVDASARSTKYVVLSKAGQEDHYYLGGNGAVRRGRTVTSSVSIKLKLDGPTKSNRTHQQQVVASLAEPKGDSYAQEPGGIDGDPGPFVQSAAVTGPAPKGAKKTERLEDEAPCPFAGLTHTTAATATKTSSATPKVAPRTKEGEQGSDPTKKCLDGITRIMSSQDPEAVVVSEPSQRPTQLLSSSGGRAIPSQQVAAPALSPASAAAPTAARPGSLAAALANRTQASDVPHLEVKALAGTGKTTTVVEDCKRMKGVPSKLTPSDEQAAVWKAMEMGRHGSIRISSFATKITDELKSRLEACGLGAKGVEARGIHSLGLAAATQRFGRLDARSAKWVIPDMVCTMLGKDLKVMKGTTDASLVWAVDDLVSLCKQTLSDPVPEELDKLTSRYGIEMDGQRDRVFDLVPQVLERCRVPEGNRITFDDMIWLPLIHELPVGKVDLQIVDESQDLNRMQQELMYRAGHRLVFVGDKHQAIYGFAGADAESMDHMRHHLAGSPQGCQTLPLTVTRRCGKAIVEEARKIVPQYQAHEDNPMGAVIRARLEEGRPDNYRKLAGPGDMVLCRCNAPLVSQCFRFIKEGRKAVILGKKVGEGLITLVEKSKAQRVPDLIAWLGDWLARETANENAKRYPSEGRLDNLQDKHDCLLVFCEGLADASDVVRKVQAVFTDNKDQAGVSLSSIHKAKGLEAQHVFILQPKGVGPRQDKMQDWELEQERNLRYVATTRAILQLAYVREM